MGEMNLGIIFVVARTIMIKWLDSGDDDEDNDDSGDDADDDEDKDDSGDDADDDEDNDDSGDDADDEDNDDSGDDADDDDEDQPASSPWSFSPSFRNLSISATACSRFSTYTRSR